jgi:ferredoxin-NADP reductase
MMFCLRKFDTGVSEALCSAELGDVVTYSFTEETGFFCPGKDQASERYAYIATGTGIAPFLSALKTYDTLPKWLLYGTKTRDDVVEFSYLRERLGSSLILCHSQEPDLGKQTLWSRVTHGMTLFEGPGRLLDAYYLCGSAGMIADASSGLAAVGVPISRIESEVFFY